MAALCMIVGMAAFGLIYRYSALGPPRAFRQGAFAVFRQELTQLPPYPNSVVSNEVDYNGPLHFPALERSYTLAATCLDVHAYYGQLTLTHGWAERASATYKGPEIYSEFRKTVGAYALRLVIECFIDLTIAPRYGLAIETV